MHLYSFLMGFKDYINMFCYIHHSQNMNSAWGRYIFLESNGSWLTVTESSFCFSFCILIDVLATLTKWSAGDITELFCKGISEKLLKICGPLGAAEVSDELRSFTSSASCCATVEIANINMSGEALHYHGRKNFNAHCHFTSHVLSETP